MPGSITFNWIARPEPSQAAKQWQQLARQIQPNLFLSASWISAWLRSFAQPDWLLEVKNTEQTVALGLFCEKWHKRPLGFNVRTLHLNMAGDEKADQIWPEYNGLLCLPEFKQVIYRRLLNNIFTAHRGIDEFDAGLISREDIAAMGVEGFVTDTQIETKSYQLTLSGVANEPVLPFSSSLKSQLSRTKRLLQEQGNLDIIYSFDTDQVLQHFEQMSGLHKKAWGPDSGFYNPLFVGFHQQLIANSSDIKPMTASLQVNGSVIARHLNYLSGHTLNFYLGVAQKYDDNRIKSGLLLHAETEKTMHEWQCSCYDFLGGDYPYKKRLSNQTRELCRMRIKRPGVKYKLESFLKSVKGRGAV